MVLTEQQWITVKNQSQKVQDLFNKVDQLQYLVNNILVFADPNNPFNSLMTMQKLLDMYSAQYSSLKTEIQTLLTALP